MSRVLGMHKLRFLKFPRYIWSDVSHIWPGSFTRWGSAYPNSKEKKLIEELREFGFSFIGYGGTRIVFLAPCKTKVFKFPRCHYGVSDNIVEANAWKNRKSLKDKCSGDDWGARIAKCKMVNNYALVMEYVDIGNRPNYADLPAWSRCLDGAQVGYNKDNKLVIYDYALDVSNFSLISSYA
jgi:hypothetical protein